MSIVSLPRAADVRTRVIQEREQMYRDVIALLCEALSATVEPNEYTMDEIHAAQTYALGAGP